MTDFDGLRKRYEETPRPRDAPLARRLAALRGFDSFWAHKVWPHPFISLAVGAAFSVAGAGGPIPALAPVGSRWTVVATLLQI